MDSFGQLIFIELSSTVLTSEEADFLKRENIGGVILTKANYEHPAQLAELINSIQKQRDEYPLFIGVQQEGGAFNAFQTQFTNFPSMLEISKLNSPKTVFETYQVMALELAACGVNLNLSPSCDIPSIDESGQQVSRAFGYTASDVEKFISAAIRGLQTNQVMACAKHFPGHGSAAKDSHLQLPIIKKTHDELVQNEIIPFIKASKSRVEFMLMGHLIVDALDDKMPASLSPKVYEFLRKETKFTKIVITDQLEAKSIKERFKPEEAAVFALLAGADMVMLKTLDAAGSALAAIREAVKKKHLNREDLIQRLQKIEKTKSANLKSYEPKYIPKIAESFNSPEAKKLLDQIKTQISP